MSNKNKVLIIIAVILILIIGISIFFNYSSKTVLETYTLNQQGLMRNDKIILDEKFDEKGNLIYYKYKSPDNNDIFEFNFKYNYDDKNRIIEACLNDRDYIKIEYDENNKISKISESISNSLSSNTNLIEFSFNYLENDEISAEKNIIYYNGNENEYTQHNKLYYKNIDYNTKKCISLIESDDNENIVTEIIYEKNSRNTNYSSFYDLINIVPLGYITEDNNFKNTQSNYNSLLLLTPIFFNGNIISIKNNLKVNQYSDYVSTELNNYYDNANRIIKQETRGYETNKIVYCMYKSINSKSYYEYKLVKTYSNSLTEYTYIQNKIYLDDNNNIYKKETLKCDKITEKNYNSKIKKFEKYFEKENK